LDAKKMPMCDDAAQVGQLMRFILSIAGDGEFGHRVSDRVFSDTENREMAEGLLVEQSFCRGEFSAD
jgi:hypothetical protein